MNREQKAAEVESLRELFGSAKTAVLLDYKGLTVSEADGLRRKIRVAEANYRVVKNTLAQRAVDGSSLEPIKDQFDGVTGVASTADDSVALAKVLHEVGKETGHLLVKAAVIEGAVVLPEQIEELAKLPGRQELLARVAVAAASPMTRLVRVLSAPSRNLAVVVSEGAKKKEAGGE